VPAPADRTPERVLLARIGAPHGIRGEVHVKPYTADPLSLGSYGPLMANDGRSFLVERVRPGKDVVIAKFRGVDDRDAAEALNGLDLYVARSALPAPEEDEYYHADLIGLAAETESGEPLGTIVAVHDFGAGDLLDIAPPRGPSRLVPFTKAVVPVVDLASGRVVVALPAEIDEEAPDETGETTG
jgi:16S rRNA processing protein RimM